MTKARFYSRDFNLTMTLNGTVWRTVDGVRLTCDKPPGFSLLDPIRLEMVAVDDGDRFVGRVNTIRVTDDHLIIEAVDLYKHAIGCVNWEELS